MVEVIDVNEMTKMNGNSGKVNCRNPIKQIVIVGGGLHGWTAAAGLARKLSSQGIDISVIETADTSKSVIGESTLPSLHHFHRFLGLKEQPLMAATQATFKLANEYTDWAAQDSGSDHSTFFHAFSPYGSMIDAVAFHQHLVKLCQLGSTFDLTDYSLSAVAAREGKFKHPAPNQKTLPFSYSLHIDAGCYTQGMKGYAQQLGVSVIQSEISETQISFIADNESAWVKHIKKLVLQDKSCIEADLFIDCTVDGELISGALGVGFKDWTDFLPCDRYLTRIEQTEDQSRAATQMRLHEAGWRRNFPLQNGTVQEYFYCSDYQTDEQARKHFTGDPDSQIDVQTQRAGRRDAFWYGNCVAMGSAAGCLGRLATSDLHLVQSAVLRLLDLIPDSSLSQSSSNSSRDEYNSLCVEEYDRILDYHVAHYSLAARSANERSSDFWQKRKTAGIPETLAHKLSLFKKTGHFPFYERETFANKTWVSLMIGLNYWPETYQMALDMPQADLGRTRSALEKISQIAANTVETMPAHNLYLKKYCPANAVSKSATTTGLANASASEKAQIKTEPVQ